MTVALHPDAVFDAGWLAVRRAADSAARDDTLNRLAAQWLRLRCAGRAARIVDLGCGSGANPAYLAPRLPGPQQWLLIDHDAVLLARARGVLDSLSDAGGAPVSGSSLLRDLAALDDDALRDADLVSASALLDLVDARFVDALCAQCAAAGAALLCALSVDGRWALDPLDGDDAFMRDAFNAHQMRDKGLGTALGPAAVDALCARLQAVGYRVWRAPSPWRLDCADMAVRALGFRLLDGWRDAALEQCPQARERILRWHGRRIADMARGVLRIEVGHGDVFACPAADAGRLERMCAHC